MAFGLREQSSQIVMFLVVLGLATGVAYWVLLKPLQAEVGQLTEENTARQGQIEQMLAVERKLPQYIREIAAQKARLEQLKAALPDEKETANIIRRVQDFAVSSNIRLKTFRPRDVVQREYYTEWPIQMEFDGSYHNLGSFFEKISRNSRVINITNLNIKRLADAEDGGNTLTASCTSTTFVYR